MEGFLSIDAILVAAGAGLVALLALLLALILLIRQNRLLKRYRLLLQGQTGQDLEQILLDQNASLESVQSQLSGLSRQVAILAEEGRLHVQRVAMLRFNAFPDTGSDLSFAIALLDANQNGLVLSSLYSRSESRVYAKPVHAGQSTYALSDEEKQVLGQAMGQKLR